MVEIHHLHGGCINLQGFIQASPLFTDIYRVFIHPRWLFGISSINSRGWSSIVGVYIPNAWISWKVGWVYPKYKEFRLWHIWRWCVWWKWWYTLCPPPSCKWDMNPSKPYLNPQRLIGYNGINPQKCTVNAQIPNPTRQVAHWYIGLLTKTPSNLIICPLPMVSFITTKTWTPQPLFFPKRGV